jgi:hypothetical protein
MQQLLENKQFAEQTDCFISCQSRPTLAEEPTPSVKARKKSGETLVFGSFRRSCNGIRTNGCEQICLGGIFERQSQKRTRVTGVGIEAHAADFE